MGTVEEYSNHFHALLPRAGRLEEVQRVQLYTGGLLPPLTHVVRLHHPETLAAAMSLARQVELMELDSVQQAPPRAAQRAPLPTPAARPAISVAQAPLALPAPPQPLAALPAPPPRGTPNPAKCLSTEEQAEQRRLGLCYSCKEPYSRGHNRVCRRIFYIDGVELDEGAVAEEAPVFSLHAVAGVPGGNTI